MSQPRSFKTIEAERQFYQMLERYEAAHTARAGTGPLAAALQRLRQGWLTLRLVTAARFGTR